MTEAFERLCKELIDLSEKIENKEILEEVEGIIAHTYHLRNAWITFMENSKDDISYALEELKKEFVFEE